MTDRITNSARKTPPPLVERPAWAVDYLREHGAPQADAVADMLLSIAPDAHLVACQVTREPDGDYGKRPLHKWKTKPYVPGRRWLIDADRKRRADPDLVAILPGSVGLQAVDVDAKHGPVVDGEAAAVAALGPPLARAVSRGNGGVHLIYPAPEGKVRNAAWEYGEVRGTEGVCVVWDPGAWLRAIAAARRSEAQPPEMKQLPGMKGGAPRSRRSQARASADLRPSRMGVVVTPDGFASVAEGRRNSTLNASVYAEASRGLLTPARYAEWLQAAHRRGLEPQEIMETMSSAAHAGRRVHEEGGGTPPPPSGGSPAAAPEVPPAPASSESDLAASFAASRGADFACAAGRGWAAWRAEEGGRGQWVVGADDLLLRTLMAYGARHFVRETADGTVVPDPRAGGRASTALGAQRSLRSRLAVSGWDADPLLAGVPGGGLVDLRTGLVRDAARGDLVTLSMGAAPVDGSGAWAAFLEQAVPDALSRRWLQRFLGYALTGLTREHKLLFVYGPSRSGKGTFLTSVADAFGNYSRRIDPADLMERAGDQHPAWLADLAGKRLVVGDEVRRGSRWDTARAKALVSGESIRARLLHSNFFEFRPSAQVVLAGNHRPELPSRDTGMTSRLLVLPFRNRPANPDPRLGERLAAALPEVAAWLVAGARSYLSDGLGPTPALVEAATREYHADCDRLADFVSGLVRGKFISNEELRGRYLGWVRAEQQQYPLSWRSVARSLVDDYGAAKARSKQARGLILPPVTE